MGKPYRDLWHETTSFTNLLRGGSWGSSVDLVRAAHRIIDDPGSWDLNIGFRCVRSQ